MKKLVLVVFLSLLLPINVSAQAIALEELQIKNGELSPNFDSLNNEYTVTLPKEEYNIEMEYKVEDGITVSAMDNFDLTNNATVTLLLIKEKEKVEYHLHILKEEEENTLVTFKEEKNPLEENFMFQYKIFIIPTSCFILILFAYKCIFRKKHKK